MVYRLRTAQGREIMATAEHPLLTATGWRPLATLGIGEHIAAARTLPSVGGTGRPRHQRIGSLGWDRIVAIAPVGVRATYDLEIEGDHNFLANDLVVHNSHASSFALLAYASAYLKAHHPAAFYAALLNNQPMGFYHAATIIKDAQRHGLTIHPIDITRSDWLCAIETETDDRDSDRAGKPAPGEIAAGHGRGDFQPKGATPPSGLPRPGARALHEPRLRSAKRMIATDSSGGARAWRQPGCPCPVQ